MTFRTSILKSIDRIRGIPHRSFDIRPYTVTLRVTTWAPPSTDDTDIQIGRGTQTDTDTPITLAGGARPKVKRVSHRETVAAGGKYQQGDFRIGPLTPDYLGGGLTFATMAPTGTGDARTQYYFVLRGPDLPADGMLCTPVQEEADHALHMYLVVRPKGVVP
jgi:hypothetical protein